MFDDQTTFDQIKDYYGNVLYSNKDLRTSAHCCSESFPRAQRAELELIDDEILAKFHGCGSPIPEGIEGSTVLDLGCGSGRDTFIVVNRHFRVTGDTSVHFGPFDCSPADGSAEGSTGGCC